MNKRITFRHTDHSEAIESYINKQIAKIEHFLENEPTPVSIDFTLEASSTRAHPRVELRIKTPHYNRVVHEEHNGTEMYEIIDKVIDRMYRLLHEDKQRMVDDRRHQPKA